MNQPMLRWYTVYYTARNKRSHQRRKVEVSATTEAEALLRARDHARSGYADEYVGARDHVRAFNNHRIFNPVVTISDRTV